MRGLTIVGAHLQFAKPAGLNRESSYGSEEHEVLPYDLQHFNKNMVGVFLNAVEIQKPKHNLDFLWLGHSSTTGSMLDGKDKLLLYEFPEDIIVFGCVKAIQNISIALIQGA